jgi:hypothetical protein
MTGFNSVETKWNADNEKMDILMQLETALTESFTSYDYESIYSLLRAYRLNADPKFSSNEREKIKTKLENITKLYNSLKANKAPEVASEFFLEAEEFFLTISRGLKEAGIYFREGKNASNAILER